MLRALPGSVVAIIVRDRRFGFAYPALMTGIARSHSRTRRGA